MPRRLLAATVAAIATAALFVLLPGTPAGAASNLVTNPGLETGTLSGWSCSLGSVVTSPVHSGSFALAGAANDSDNAQCTQTIAVQPNSAYTLSAWVRGSYVFIGVTGGVSTWTPSATSYTQLSVQFTTGASTSSVQIYLHGWYAQGTYNADDVSLTGPGGTVTPPAAPTGLTVTGTTASSVSLSWAASSGATGYNVYRNGTRALTGITSTSATVSGLPASTTSTFTVSATNSAGESPQSAGVQATTGSGGGGGSGSPRSWPYIDITFSSPTLADVARATGQKFFTLAFVLGDSTGCNPSWGGTIPLTDSRILGEIRDLKALGGDVAVSFGGAAGPYLMSVCSTVASQVSAYERVMDTLAITHLDFDIEASVPTTTMNQAIAQVQRDRAGTVVSYTLEVQAADFGLTPALGVDVLTNAKSNGVNVGIVNPMTMDFGQPSTGTWGDAVISAAQSTLNQMAQIWPEKTAAQRARMLGVTPMIGRNDTGPIFTQDHARQLVSWANTNHIGQLGFWSVGRDNGGCPGGGVSPTCSSISQTTYEFTTIFAGFTG
jgi:hypothetical protein